MRQYASHGGTVFAVAWSGRSLPDLSIVLAKYFDDYVAAAAAHHGNHHVLTVTTPQFVISVVKHPRGLTGSAHLPGLLPAGISPQELR